MYAVRDIRHEVMFCDEHVDVCSRSLLTMKSLSCHFDFVPIHATQQPPTTPHSLTARLTTHTHTLLYIIQSFIIAVHCEQAYLKYR